MSLYKYGEFLKTVRSCRNIGSGLRTARDESHLALDRTLFASENCDERRKKIFCCDLGNRDGKVAAVTRKPLSCPVVLGHHILNVSVSAMGLSLPRILDDKKLVQLPSPYVAPRQLNTPKITLSDVFPTRTSHLLRFRKYSLPSKCYRSPLKKQPFRIAFHPQRVRRTNRKRIERVILPMLLSGEPGYSKGLLRSFESKALPVRSEVPIKAERPRAFCMFLSKQDQKRFFVPSRSVLQQKAWTVTVERDIKPRDEAPYRGAQDLTDLIKLGFSGALASPRQEGCIRDFLEAKSLFPGDDKRRERIEKEATEFKPRMTFTR